MSDRTGSIPVPALQSMLAGQLRDHGDFDDNGDLRRGRMDRKSRLLDLFDF
jgi:hypothetical protein